MTNEVREMFEFMASGGRSVLNNYGSRAASAPQDDVRITEMINGVLVSKPAPKHSEEEGPIVIDLQEYARSNSKAASSTPAAVNPVKEIFEFLNLRKYYYY